MLEETPTFPHVTIDSTILGQIKPQPLLAILQKACPKRHLIF